MSNSYLSPPNLVDPSRVTAGLTLRTTEVSKLGELQNYSFAQGGCVDVVAQSWGDSVFRVDATVKTVVCEWYIPRPSNSHNTFKLRIACHRSASGSKVGGALTFPLSGNSYSQDVVITDTNRYGTVFEEVTISVTGSENELFCKLSLFTDLSSGYVELANINGSWSPLSSPLTVGILDQGSDQFTPQGINRLGADRPLSARFGVETFRNITTLRKRGRTLLNWSGAFSWNSYGLSLRLSELERYSRDFRLSMYQVGLMPTARNQAILLGDNNRITSNPVYIKGLSIIGV